MLIVSEFVVELDTTIVNVALPDIGRTLGAGTDALQWVVDGYTLVFGGLLLVAGAAADRLGRRRVLLAGLALFAGASLVASLAPTTGWLIGARAGMGLGAAMILPTTLSILIDVFSTAERERAFSVWSATAGLSFALGPTVGGALVKSFEWSSVFLINLPIVAIATAGCIVLVPRARPENPPAPDVIGGALSVSTLGILLYAIIEAPKHGWGSPATIAGFAAAAVLLACFLAWQYRAPNPMIDLHLLRSRTFSGATASIALTFLAIAGALFVLTQYLQLVLGYSALAAGVRLLPVAGCVLVAAPLSIAVEQRIGTSATVSLGLAMTAGGLATMTGMTTSSGYGRVALGLVLAGGGMGLALTPATTAMLATISQGRAGSSAALNNTAVIVGSALGVAILGSVLASRYAREMGSVLHGLPAHAALGAKASVAAAAEAARQSPSPVLLHLLAQAREAFVVAARHTFLVASLIAAAGAAIAAVMLPRRRSEPTVAAPRPAAVGD